MTVYMWAFAACGSFFTFLGLNLALTAPVERTVLEIVCYILLVTMLEEGLFRYCIMRLARKLTGSWRAALWIQAALFAVWHFYNPAVIPFAFLMGMCFGMLYLKSGRIDAPYLVHMTANTAAMLRSASSMEGDNVRLAGLIALLTGLVMITMACVRMRKFEDRLQIGRGKEQPDGEIRP